MVTEKAREVLSVRKTAANKYLKNRKEKWELSFDDIGIALSLRVVPEQPLAYQGKFAIPSEGF